MEVGAFIDPIRKDWNVDLLKQVLLPFEVERVCKIPLSRRLPPDSLCWDLEKDGVYSVRSAYRALFADVRCEESGPVSMQSEVWKLIWGGAMLPRIKLFAWRACLEALPTRCELHARVQAMNLVVRCVGLWRKRGCMSFTMVL